MSRTRKTHRIWMVAWFGSLGLMVTALILVHPHSAGGPNWLPTIVFAAWWLISLISFFGLAIFANRLAGELKSPIAGIPLWLIYLTGWGTFLSFWLDRQGVQLGPSEVGSAKTRVRD